MADHPPSEPWATERRCNARGKQRSSESDSLDRSISRRICWLSLSLAFHGGRGSSDLQVRCRETDANGFCEDCGLCGWVHIFPGYLCTASSTSPRRFAVSLTAEVSSRPCRCIIRSDLGFSGCDFLCLVTLRIVSDSGRGRPVAHTLAGSLTLRAPHARFFLDGGFFLQECLVAAPRSLTRPGQFPSISWPGHRCIKITHRSIADSHAAPNRCKSCRIKAALCRCSPDLPETRNAISRYTYRDIFVLKSFAIIKSRKITRYTFRVSESLQRVHQNRCNFRTISQTACFSLSFIDMRS